MAKITSETFLQLCFSTNIPVVSLSWRCYHKGRNAGNWIVVLDFPDVFPLDVIKDITDQFANYVCYQNDEHYSTKNRN